MGLAWHERLKLVHKLTVHIWTLHCWPREWIRRLL